MSGRAVASLCLVAGLAVSLLVPAAARAGTYQVAVCHDPESLQGAPLDGLSFPSSGQYVDSGVYGGGAGTCTTGGYVYATLDGVAAHGPTDAAVWEFTAPPATQIASAEIYRYLYAGASAAYQSPVDTIEVISSNGAATAVATCTQALACTSVGTSPIEQSLYPYNVFDQVDQLPLSGANAGKHTAAMLKRGARVIAAEPQADLARALERNFPAAICCRPRSKRSARSCHTAHRHQRSVRHGVDRGRYPALAVDLPHSGVSLGTNAESRLGLGEHAQGCR